MRYNPKTYDISAQDDIQPQDYCHRPKTYDIYTQDDIRPMTIKDIYRGRGSAICIKSE